MGPNAIVFTERRTNFESQFQADTFTVLGTAPMRFFVVGALVPKLVLPVVNLIKPRICVEYDPTEWRKFVNTARHHVLLKCYMILSFKYKFGI